MRIALAFAVVYLVWGSTYLGIRVVVAELPPLLAAGVRYLIAGVLLYAYAHWRGQRLPRAWRDWRRLAFTGVLMIVGGNGLVSWAEQWVESNQAALIVATAAFWFAGLGALGPKGERLHPWTIVGLVGGFLGVALLLDSSLRLGSVPWQAYAALMLSAFLWSLGSIYAKRRPAQAEPLMTAVVHMLSAGAVMAVAGLLNGEAARWQWEPRSLVALAYLIVFGSCIAYACFVWLVHHVTPAQLGTYAYVNPAIAVLLGWWILDEQLNATQLFGTGVILASVLLVTIASTARTRRSLVAT
jgi:drug/metabolite transporter (DMT)-like permease